MRPTRGEEVANVARLLGRPLTPWQRLVADVSLELLPDGSLAYSKVIVLVPRQNGKTTLIMGVECWRATAWTEAQHVGYTAQDGNAARKKLIQEQAPIIERSRMRSLLFNIYRGVGDERVLWKNGSQIDVVASSASSGHGRTYDMVVFDEAFDDADDRREQALIPSLITRPSTQTWVISTAGDEGSVYLRRQVEMGRAAVAAGDREGIAYFEWSAPDEADIDDPKTWWSCMPALGHTITEKKISEIRATSTESLFRRMMLNQWTSSEEAVIPPGLWNLVCVDEWPEKGDLDRSAVTFALDVNPERSSASIAVADTTGKCELVETGLSPVAGSKRAIELALKWSKGGYPRVVIDAKGPAALFKSEIELEGVMCIEYQAPDMAKACARIYDAVADRTVQILRSTALDQARAAASKRVILDTWTWSRTGAADISPLVALTMAFDKAAQAKDVWVFTG
jgi:hypothetical protein